MLERARQENPRAKFALTGCLPVNYFEEAQAMGVDYVYGTKDAAKFVEQLKQDNSLESISCEVVIKQSKSRYFMKVQDGCQQFCTYCIIPYNRGQLESRPLDEVLTEAGQAVAVGYREIVLCGIHLGLYGVDLGEMPGVQRITLVGLMKELFKIDNLEKIRLSSIEITEVTDEMIELMRSERQFARHLHISLQSGCDKILKSMNRPYTTEYFADRVSKLRAAAPEVAISTDVIVGFPGETEVDFQTTLEFCRAIGFSKIHVFPFSAHEKTPACNFPEQIDEAAKKQRARALQKLSQSLERRYNESFVGQSIEVIIDGRSQGATYRGKSEYYFDVEFESAAKYRVGELVRVKDWQLIK